MAKIGDITGKAVKALTGSRPGKDQASNANDPSTPDQFSKSFNISDFKARVSSVNGLMRPNLFGVQITHNPLPSTEGEDNSETVSLLCNAINIPGVSFATSDVQRQGFGPLERRVANAIFPAVSATFMLDNKGQVLEFFNFWAKRIASFAHQAGDLSRDIETGGALGEVGYYDDYVTNIDIFVFEPTGSKITKYTLVEAYPAVIGDISLGWRQNDEIGELQVQFNYRHWTSSAYKAASASPEDKSFNLLQFINKVNGAVQIAKSLKKPRSIGDALNVINNGETLLGIFK
jgi:hypothetical protein